jgi:hypothetical protein
MPNVTVYVHNVESNHFLMVAEMDGEMSDLECILHHRLNELQLKVSPCNLPIVWGFPGV